jgi:phage tail sheath protein FI
VERLHPGVYIEEVAGGARPIEGVSTSTTAFLGKAAKGPLGTALLITNFTEFKSNFGGFLNDSFLAVSALQFFNNGGRRLYVVRVANGAAVAGVTIADRQATPVAALELRASSAGVWANDVSVVVAASDIDATNEFKLTVRVGGTPVEVFDNLSMNPEQTNFIDRVVGAGSALITAKANAGSDTAVAGTSVSAASPADSLAAPFRSLVIDVDGDGPQTINLSDPLTTSAEIASALQAAVRALAPQRASTPPAAFSGFTASFGASAYTLTSGSTGKRSSVRVSSAAPAVDAAARLKLGARNGGTETSGAAALRPALGSYQLGAPVAGNVTASTVGSDGGTPQDPDYIAALSVLDSVVDLNLLAVPGIGTRAVVDAGTGYCSNRMDCFFIGDMGATDDTPAEGQAFVNALTVRNSYGAVYFPWLRALDPTGTSPTPILVPPSGYIAGIFARTDARRGVWKAPAGTEAGVIGAVGLASQINDAQQDTLNPIGANAIRFFASSGIVVWGARTLGVFATPEYKYVPVRRLAIFLERSIYNGIQWAVFEPNDEDLWASLRLNIGAFMMNVYRAGAFQGATPSEAFFVKCDGETNPQSEIDAGVVTVLVGFAPVKPAEFVVVRISQKTLGSG